MHAIIRKITNLFIVIMSTVHMMMNELNIHTKLIFFNVGFIIKMKERTEENKRERWRWKILYI